MVIELIDPNGSVPIETDADILALRSDGCLRTIQLDANLTLDLAKVGGKKTPAGTSGALPLLQVAALSDSAIDCDLAIEELSLGAVRATGDTTRAVTLRRDVATGLSFVERELGVRRGSILVGHLGSKEVRSYQRVHLLSYVHLLRIEQIARDRPGKATAVDNVAEYVRWANHDLRSISAHSLQVALDVFGGEPRAARLLGVASSRSQEGRAWNAAWDLVHAYSMHFETSHKVGKRMKRALLASRDRALLYVACRCVVAVYVRDSPLGDTTFAAMQIDQPFLAPRKAEVKQLLAETFVAQRRRIDGLESATPSDLARVRDELETQLGIRDRRPAP